jgi:hypothetical protein
MTHAEEGNMIDTMTATSRWATGTYELVLDWTGDDEADVVATIFAKPLEVGSDADEDAPILSQMGMLLPELGERRGIFAEEKPAVVDIGEHGLVPEDLEREFGPKTGIRLLLLLFQAANADFKGVDMDGAPWREPSTEAYPIMERTHDVMAILKTRIYNM